MAFVTSAPTAEITVEPTLLTAWLKDPRDPTRNTALACLDGLTWTRGRGQAVLTPLGRPDPVVQTDVRRLRTGQAAATPMTQAEYDALDLLLASGRTLLLQAPAAEDGWRGEHVYFVATGDDTDAPVGPVPRGARTVTFGVTEVRQP